MLHHFSLTFLPSNLPICAHSYWTPFAYTLYLHSASEVRPCSCTSLACFFPLLSNIPFVWLSNTVLMPIYCPRTARLFPVWAFTNKEGCYEYSKMSLFSPICLLFSLLKIHTELRSKGRHVLDFSKMKVLFSLSLLHENFTCYIFWHYQALSAFTCGHSSSILCRLTLTKRLMNILMF